MTTEEMLAEAIRLLKKYVPPGFSEVIDFLKHTERIEQDKTGILKPCENCSE